MNVCCSKFIFLCLFICLSGCKWIHSRPPGVPPTAVWVDSVFVDCSVEAQSKANWCTVYKDDTGEIVADGLFVLNSSHLAAEKSELHYATFGEQGIYLEDTRILLQRAASQRDPSNHIIDNRLRTLASGNGVEALDCRKAGASGKTDAVAECALKAFADRRPFYVSYYLQFPDSFGYEGYAGDADGHLYGVEYKSGRVHFTGAVPKAGQLFDDNHSFVMPCPKPTILYKAENGNVTCIRPIV
jgi:hypothetical protein